MKITISYIQRNIDNYVKVIQEIIKSILFNILFFLILFRSDHYSMKNLSHYDENKNKRSFYADILFNVPTTTVIINFFYSS